MRIISGYFKGKKIIEPNSKNTRPLKDLTKESIFNILQHNKYVKIKIEKSEVLDLFSGVGSFGLECISREAKNVIFFENYPQTLKILKKNINEFNCENKTQIVTENIFKSNYLENIKKNKFEIIFLDPPYKEKRLNDLLIEILNLKILKKNGIIIIHRHKKENDIFPEKLKIFKVKNYGISKITFGLIP
tara:strand:+ start:260 stop:826 length:567 start_codon:yes stop_codon:yes gene_type:complete